MPHTYVNFVPLRRPPSPPRPVPFTYPRSMSPVRLVGNSNYNTSPDALRLRDLQSTIENRLFEIMQMGSQFTFRFRKLEDAFKDIGMVGCWSFWPELHQLLSSLHSEPIWSDFRGIYRSQRICTLIHLYEVAATRRLESLASLTDEFAIWVKRTAEEMKHYEDLQLQDLLFGDLPMPENHDGL